jgi:hypothetical protein
MNAFFPGFERKQIQVSGVSNNLVRGGNGPAVSLLHGYTAAKKLGQYVGTCPAILKKARIGLRSSLDSSTIQPQIDFGQTVGVYGKTYS